MKDTAAPKYSYGVNPDADFSISNVDYDLNGTGFTISYRNNKFNISTSLVGEFNAYNAAFAFAATTLLGIDPDTAVTGIRNTPQVPGRFEVTGNGGKKVIIDYSHNCRQS